MLAGLSKILLSGLLSLSLRTARVQPNPTDYEIKGGLKTVAFQTEVKYERENGEYYRGLAVKTEPLKIKMLSKGLSGEINIDEADGINRQYIYYTLLGGRSFRLRTTNNWDNWGCHQLLIGAVADIELGNFRGAFQLDSNLEHSIFRNKISCDLIKEDDWYISPFVKYESYDGKKLWQVKVEYVKLFLGGRD